MDFDEVYEEKEPSCPWAKNYFEFDWDEERGKQALEGPRWKESETERREREESILP